MPVSEIYNMDCMEYMRTVPDKWFDLAVVDPPYGDGNAAIGGGKRFGGIFDRYKVCKEDRRQIREVRKKILSWDEAPRQEYFNELFRVSKQQIIWGANYFSGLPPTRCFLVWNKLIPEKFSMAMVEYAWTSLKGNAKMFSLKPQGNSKNPRIHPTQKPVALYEWIFRNYASQGCRILDTHLGSGSSRIAAYKMGFDFYGCEIDRQYYEEADNRFRRECLGEIDTYRGTVKQLSIFT